jgi:hypothetical protein
VRDPHVHVEHAGDLGFTTQRRVIVAALGVAPSAPRTVRTGCDRRRPLAMTSTVPESVTCLACRQFAAGCHREWAELGRAALSLPDSATIDRRELAASVARHDDLAARFAR